MRGTRNIGKAQMVHNDYQPEIDVDPETYEVRADGELLVCEPASRAADGAALFPLLTGSLMLEIRHKLRIARHAYALKIGGRLVLPFEQRQKTRLRTALDGGEEVALKLPRGEILRGGDLVVASDGRIIEIVAAIEKVLHVDADSPANWRARRITWAIATCRSRSARATCSIGADHVLEAMLQRLGGASPRSMRRSNPRAGHTVASISTTRGARHRADSRVRYACGRARARHAHDHHHEHHHHGHEHKQ